MIEQMSRQEEPGRKRLKREDMKRVNVSEPVRERKKEYLPTA